MQKLIEVPRKVWRCIAEDLARVAAIGGFIVFAAPLLARGSWLLRQYALHSSLAWCLTVTRTLLPGPVPLCCVGLGIVTVIVGRRLGAYSSSRGTAALIIAGAIPSFGAILEALKQARLFDSALVVGSTSPSEFAARIVQSISAQLDIVSLGCLRSAMLLLAVGAMPPPKTLRRLDWPQWHQILPGMMIIASLALRFKICHNLDQMDVAAVVALALAIVLVKLTEPESPSLPFALLVLTLVLSFIELSARSDVFAQLLNPIRPTRWPPIWQIRATRESMSWDQNTTSMFVAKYTYRGYSAFCSPGLIMIAWALTHRRGIGKIRWSAQSAWLLGAIALVITSLIFSANPLKWTGAMRCPVAVKTRLDQLSLDTSSARNAPATEANVPDILSGSAIKVNNSAASLWLPWGGPKSDVYSPLLAVSPNLNLRQLLKALASGFHEGHRSYRWITTEPNELGAKSGEFLTDLLRQLRAFTTIEIEIDPNLRMDTRSGIYAGNQTWSAALIDEAAALLIPVVRTDSGYTIIQPHVTWDDLSSLPARSKAVPGDSLLLVWDPDARLTNVVRAAKSLTQHGFRRLVVATGRDLALGVLTKAFHELSRKTRSKSVEAELVFNVVRKRNVGIAIEDVELVEGTLIADHIECFDGGFLTSQNCGLDLDLTIHGSEIELIAHPTTKDRGAFGFTIERNTGLVRSSSGLANNPHIRDAAPQGL